MLKCCGKTLAQLDGPPKQLQSEAAILSSLFYQTIYYASNYDTQ